MACLTRLRLEDKSLHPDRLEFTRQSERRTSDEKLRSGLEFIAQTAIGKFSGWEFKIGTIAAWERSQLYFSSCPQYVREAMGKELQAQWHFSSWIEFYRTRPASLDPEKAKEREEFQRKEIYERAAMTGHSQRFGTHPWVTRLEKTSEKVKSAIILGDTVEDEKEVDKEVTDPIEDMKPVSLSTISHIKPGNYFDHLYGLDAQVRILLSAVQAAADSNMENRFHSLLFGEPGTGKTDILRSTYRLLSDLNISCLSIDATSTTEAGMRKYLLDEDEIMPEVILIEEIEKAAHSFLLLLGIMDERGTVSQMNARRTASRKIPALVLANANDYGMLMKLNSGALLSRFSNEIYCPRLNRETLARFLQRELDKVRDADSAWIEPTLEFGFDRMGVNDPRQLKRICLCGKDRLLTGEYQQDLERTMKRAIGNGSGSGLTSKTLDMGDI